MCLFFLVHVSLLSPAAYFCPGVPDVLLPAAPVAGGHPDGLLLPPPGDPVDPHPTRVLRGQPALQDHEVPPG